MRGAESRKDVTNGWPGAEAPGPAELAGTLGGAQGARRIVGARLAAASSRRIPGRGTPVLTARTGAPLDKGWRRDRPAVQARSPSPAAIPPTTSAGVTQRCSAAGRPLQGTPRRPPPPPARPRSPRPPPRHATSYLQVTCFVQPPPLPSLPPPPPPAPGDRAATVGIGVREAAATAAAAAPAPDVVAVVPGAAASAITVYPTQQWPRNFRDHIVPVRLRG